LRAGDAFARDVVNEAGRFRTNGFDPRRRSGRRDQANVEQRLTLHGQIFFGREIENQETVDAGIARFAMKSLEPEVKDRVQVGVEDDRYLRDAADLPDAIENALDRGAPFERALGGKLVHDAIREW